MLYLGRRDVARAMWFFELAHELENGESAYCLASLILASNTERRDRAELEKARGLLEHAERGGDGRTRHNLALVLSWLDPSDASLKERVDRIFGESARLAEQRQEELDRNQDICEQAAAKLRDEAAELRVLRKAAKHAERLAVAQRNEAKTAELVKKQNREREDRRRYDAATPQNPDDTFYEDFNELVGRFADEHGGVASAPSTVSSEQRFCPGKFFDTFEHTGSGDESGFDFAVHGMEDEPREPRRMLPIQGEKPTATRLARDSSVPRAQRPEPPPQGARASAPDPTQVEKPKATRVARDSSVPRAESPEPPQGPSKPIKRGRGRPIGSTDSKERAAYGSKTQVTSGRGPGRPAGTKDAVKRKRKTKAEVTAVTGERGPGGRGPERERPKRKQVAGSSLARAAQSSDPDSDASTDSSI